LSEGEGLHVDPGVASAAIACATRCGSLTRAESSRGPTLVRTGTASAIAEHPLGIRALCRVRSRTCSAPVPTEALSSLLVPSAMTRAVVDHRDAVGELVRLVEVLGREQHGRAAATSARTISQTWFRLRGSSPVVGSSRKIRSG
jgi:hypothetical protein